VHATSPRVVDGHEDVEEDEGALENKLQKNREAQHTTRCATQA
jgi:hypothetical protein